jgi:hypothetical protein
MASYLVCLAVARYDRIYSGTLNIGGINMPIMYYIFRGKDPTRVDAIASQMDKQKEVVMLYSRLFGNYPFAKEKHGFYEGCPAGGMEHQGFSAINSGALEDNLVLAHELMHQWFGDKVTFGTWNHLWLAEGFASYGEVLAAEYVTALGENALSLMQHFKATAQNQATSTTYISDISSSAAIWAFPFSSNVYNRGCMVVSMLRTMCGDTLFFNTMKKYCTSPTTAYKTATTDTLANFFNTSLGQNITPFFDDYINGTGQPSVTLNCNNLPNNYFSVSVASSIPSTGSTVSYFRTPITINIKGALLSQDTTITFFDWGSGNLSYAGNGISAPIAGNKLLYKLSFKPITITVDPLSKTLINGTVLLDKKVLEFYAVKKEKNNTIIATLNNNYTNLPLQIERSTNGIYFEKIGEMKIITSTGQTKQAYTDNAPTNSYNYYRAWFVDNEGKKIYTPIATVNNSYQNNNVSIAVLPNKVVLLQNAVAFYNTNATITIKTTEGKTLLQQKKYITHNSQIALPQSVASGTYILNIIHNNTQISKQFVIN